jgi:hypothetical protein
MLSHIISNKPASGKNKGDLLAFGKKHTSKHETAREIPDADTYNFKDKPSLLLKRLINNLINETMKTIVSMIIV